MHPCFGQNSSLVTLCHICQIECYNNVLPLISSFLQYNHLFQLLFVLSVRNIFKKFNSSTFEDTTCGLPGIPSAMNFILGGISLDSLKGVHSELLGSCGVSLSLLDLLSIILIFRFLTLNTMSLYLHHCFHFLYQ